MGDANRPASRNAGPEPPKRGLVIRPADTLPAAVHLTQVVTGVAIPSVGREPKPPDRLLGIPTNPEAEPVREAHTALGSDISRPGDRQ